MTNRAPLIVALFLLILIYVAGYFALVQQGASRGSFRPCPAECRVGGRGAEGLFYPVHAIDRALRPWVWGTAKERMIVSPWRRMLPAASEEE